MCAPTQPFSAFEPGIYAIYKIADAQTPHQVLQDNNNRFGYYYLRNEATPNQFTEYFSLQNHVFNGVGECVPFGGLVHKPGNQAGCG